MYTLIAVVLTFLCGFLLSLGLDSLAYFFKYMPSDNVSFVQYFYGSELLTCAVGVGILFIIMFVPCIGNRNESTTN